MSRNMAKSLGLETLDEIECSQVFKTLEKNILIQSMFSLDVDQFAFFEIEAVCSLAALTLTYRYLFLTKAGLFISRIIIFHSYRYQKLVFLPYRYVL